MIVSSIYLQYIPNTTWRCEKKTWQNPQIVPRVNFPGAPEQPAYPPAPGADMAKFS